MLDSGTKAPLEMVVIDRLAEVTNHPIVQGAVPTNLIRVCRNEDRRDRVACVDEVSVEFDASHSRHLWTSATKQAVSGRRGDPKKSAAGGNVSTV